MSEEIIDTPPGDSFASVPIVATIEPVARTAGTSLAKAIGPVPVGEEWSVSVRVCIGSGSAEDSFDLHLRKAGVGAYRCRAHPLALGSGTYDIEQRLTLTAGWELWDRSAAGAVDATYSGTRRTTA